MGLAATGLLGAIGLVAAGPLLAEEPPAPEGPRVHALVGARIVVDPDRIIEQGTLVIRDGLIEAVGADLTAPPDARIWDLEGLTLYPGLVESLAEQPWPDQSPPLQGSRVADRVTPERDISLYAFDMARAKQLRKAGFTTAHIVPKEGVFRGQSAILSLGDSTLSANLLARGVSQYVALDPAKDEGYGNSLMGAVALFRQTLLDARWYGETRPAFETGKTPRRVPFDRSLEALRPAAKGEQPFLFEASSLLEVLRVARLSRELDLRAWVVGTGKEYQRLSAVKAAGLPILLPMNFPEAPEVGKEGDDLTVSLEDLRHWDRAPDNCLDLLDMGLTVAFTSHGLESPEKMYSHIATAAERGLKAEETLAALTTVPAKLLGIDHLVGTLEPGKLAHIVVVDGELWDKKPKIREVWIDGRRYEVSDRKNPTADPVGLWQLNFLVGDQGGRVVDLQLRGTADKLEGEVVTETAPHSLASIELEGNVLELSYQGPEGEVRLSLELKGDRAKGHGRGPDGSFAVQGRRTVPEADSIPPTPSAPPQATPMASRAAS